MRRTAMDDASSVQFLNAAPSSARLQRVSSAAASSGDPRGGASSPELALAPRYAGCFRPAGEGEARILPPSALLVAPKPLPWPLRPLLLSASDPDPGDESPLVGGLVGPLLIPPPLPAPLRSEFRLLSATPTVEALSCQCRRLLRSVLVPSLALSAAAAAPAGDAAEECRRRSKRRRGDRSALGGVPRDFMRSRSSRVRQSSSRSSDSSVAAMLRAELGDNTIGNAYYFLESMSRGLKFALRVVLLYGNTPPFALPHRRKTRPRVLARRGGTAVGLSYRRCRQVPRPLFLFFEGRRGKAGYQEAPKPHNLLCWSTGVEVFASTPVGVCLLMYRSEYLLNPLHSSSSQRLDCTPLFKIGSHLDSKSV